MAGQPSAAQPSVGVGWARGLAEVQMGGLALLLVCGNSLAKASQMWEMKSDPGNQRASACVRRCCSVRRGRRPVLSLRNRFWRYLCRKTPEKKVAKSICAHKRPCTLSPVVADGPISCLQPIKLRRRRKQAPVWFLFAATPVEFSPVRTDPRQNPDRGRHLAGDKDVRLPPPRLWKQQPATREAGGWHCQL